MQKVEFTQEDFEKAFDNASYWSKRRLEKKSNKKKFRAAYWSEGHKDPEDPEFGPPRLMKRYLPPKDLEQWQANWIVVNKDKSK